LEGSVEKRSRLLSEDFIIPQNLTISQEELKYKNTTLLGMN
jgi:hypothetical protein